MTTINRNLSFQLALCFSLAVLPACKTTPVAEENSISSRKDGSFAGACIQLGVTAILIGGLALGITPSCQTKHSTH